MEQLHAKPDKVKLKNSYHKRQLAFHQMLDDIPAEIWIQKLPDSDWLVCHNLWHVTLVQAVFTHEVQGIRRGRNYPLNGKAILDLLSTLIAYKIQSRPSKQKVREQFDSSLAEFLKVLDEIGEREWELTGKLAGKEHTIYELYRGAADHIDEHMDRLRKLLP